MMLIRPPVVRELRHNLWVSMMGGPSQSTSRASAGEAGREASAVDVRLANLKELGELRASGVLTDEEFAREKARLLG